MEIDKKHLEFLKAKGEAVEKIAASLKPLTREAVEQMLNLLLKGRKNFLRSDKNLMEN